MAQSAEIQQILQDLDQRYKDFTQQIGRAIFWVDLPNQTWVD